MSKLSIEYIIHMFHFSLPLVFWLYFHSSVKCWYCFSELWQILDGDRQGQSVFINIVNKFICHLMMRPCLSKEVTKFSLWSKQIIQLFNVVFLDFCSDGLGWVTPLYLGNIKSPSIIWVMSSHLLSAFPVLLSMCWVRCVTRIFVVMILSVVQTRLHWCFWADASVLICPWGRKGEGEQCVTLPPPSTPASSTHKIPLLQIFYFVCSHLTWPDQHAEMRDEFSQILDSVWEETLPGDKKLCLADMKVLQTTLHTL